MGGEQPKPLNPHPTPQVNNNKCCASHCGVVEWWGLGLWCLRDVNYLGMVSRYRCAGRNWATVSWEKKVEVAKRKMKLMARVYVGGSGSSAMPWWYAT